MFISIETPENLALKKPASQSDVIVNGVASRAVDGDPNGDWHGGKSCISTSNKRKSPWWAVDLKQEYKLTKVVVTTRDTKCKHIVCC